jgi:hypothetical protein
VSIIARLLAVQAVTLEEVEDAARAPASEPEGTVGADADAMAPEVCEEAATPGGTNENAMLGPAVTSLPDAPAADPEPVAPETGVGLCELSRKTCRWPCWQDGDTPSAAEARYCGAEPTNDSVYCSEHSLTARRVSEAAATKPPEGRPQFRRTALRAIRPRPL